MIKLIDTISIENFEAWSGGVNTLNTIIANDKIDDMDYLLEEIFPDGCTPTQLNDFLWFDDEFIFESLGIEEE